MTSAATHGRWRRWALTAIIVLSFVLNVLHAHPFASTASQTAVAVTVSDGTPAPADVTLDGDVCVNCVANKVLLQLPVTGFGLISDDRSWSGSLAGAIKPSSLSAAFRPPIG